MPTRLLSVCVAAVVASGFLAGTPRASASYVLDTFDNPNNPSTFYQITLLNGNPYTSPATSVGSGVSRTITVQVVTPVQIPTQNAVGGQIGGGIFTVDVNNSNKAIATIDYNLTGAAQNLSGATGLELGFLNLDAGNTSGIPNRISATVTVTDTANHTMTINTTIGGSINPFDKDILFSGSSVNLGSVKKISFVLNGTNPLIATDFALDNVKVLSPVPAPAGLVLGAIGFAGLLGGRSLRRKAVVAA